MLCTLYSVQSTTTTTTSLQQHPAPKGVVQAALAAAGVAGISPAGQVTVTG